MSTPILSPVSTGLDLLRESATLTRRLLADAVPFNDLPDDARPRVEAFARRVAAASGDAVADLQRVGEELMPQARPARYAEIGRQLLVATAAGEELASGFDLDHGRAKGAVTVPPKATAEEAEQGREIRAATAAALDADKLSRATLVAQLSEEARTAGWTRRLVALLSDPVEPNRFVTEGDVAAIHERLVEYAGVRERLAALRLAAQRARWIGSKIEAAGRSLAGSDER